LLTQRSAKHNEFTQFDDSVEHVLSELQHKKAHRSGRHNWTEESSVVEV